MGVFDVLKFWKRREAKAAKLPETPAFAAPMPPATPSLPGFNIPRLPEQPDAAVAPAPEFQPFPSPASMAPAGAGVSGEKDFQLLSAKLDALRAKLELIDQRILKIERIAEESQ